MERTAVAQKGLSPKLLADLIVSAAAFVLLALLGVDLEHDPVLAAAIAKAAGFLAGALVGPGRVVVEDHGPPSDDLLPASALRELENESAA